MNDIDNQEATLIFKTCLANNNVEQFQVFLNHMPQYAALALELCVKDNNIQCATIALSYCNTTCQDSIDKSLTYAANGDNLAMVELLFDRISPNFECNSALFFASLNDNSAIIDIVWERSNVDTVIDALRHLGGATENAIERLQTLRDHKQAAAQKQHLEDALLIAPEAIANKRQQHEKSTLVKKM